MARIILRFKQIAELPSPNYATDKTFEVSMKAWLFSDLHLEIDPSAAALDIPNADVCICAGDILDGGVSGSLAWLEAHVSPYMPVVFVPGNHEYYRSSIGEGLAAGYDFARDCDNLFLLDGDSLHLGGIRFIGATLWTDFGLHSDRRLSMAIANENLNDYRRIKLQKKPFKRFTPQESSALHRAAAINIDNIYRSQPDLPTVIVSHHAPSLMSVPREFLTDPLTPAFASRFEYRILEYEPILWVHGHIHKSSDYFLGNTRVVCNPLGYPGESSRKSFIPDLVIDLGQLSKT